MLKTTQVLPTKVHFPLFFPPKPGGVYPKMKKLNVAMVAACPFPANRGTPSRILRMAEGLSNWNVDVAVATYHFGTDIQAKNVDVFRIPKVPYRNFSPGPTFTKLLLLDPLLSIRLLNLVRARKIDIIHAHHFEGALIAYLVRKITGIKVIYDAHTTLSDELHHYDFIQNRFLTSYLDRSVPQNADHIIAVSCSLKEFFLNYGIDTEKIDVVPTGVNLDVFEDRNPEIVKKKYQLQDKRIVMYTGTLTDYQGIPYLLKAMKEVFQRHQDVVLVLVGSFGNEKYKKICAACGMDQKVIFVGDRPFSEIPDFLAAADVVVCPRVDCPGHPQKITNYMAARKAIVCFKGSAKILSDQENALIVEDGDDLAMAFAIMKLLGNPALREVMGRNARQSLETRYDWPHLSRQVRDIYEKVIG
jgi:glycosyltransferase involved in cell wall biosynthesis